MAPNPSTSLRTKALAIVIAILVMTMATLEPSVEDEAMVEAGEVTIMTTILEMVMIVDIAMERESYERGLQMLTRSSLKLNPRIQMEQGAGHRIPLISTLYIYARE
jgi:predicted amino acid-binding ACT domain protein